MPFDPTITRARIQIAGDRALLKELTDAETRNGSRQDPEAQARINSLRRLIAANEKLLAGLSG